MRVFEVFWFTEQCHPGRRDGARENHSNHLLPQGNKNIRKISHFYFNNDITGYGFSPKKL